ncbi:MAG: hypothetical protein HZA53_15260 [Planctomycetes bacterium]|nr:hypothetical protein [Planctomycetota bacterium]
MHAYRRPLRSLSLAAFLLATPALAQDFNLDVGAATGNPVPLASFGAGAARPGTWGIAPTLVATPAALTDITGTLTAVTSTLSGGGNYANVANLGGATVNDLNLMSDIHDVGALPQTWTFTNLAAGTYDVYTYAMAPDSAAYLTHVSIAGSIDPAQDVGGAWTNAYVLGVTHAKHRITVAAGSPVVVSVSKTASPPAPNPNHASVNGFQFVLLPANGAPFCFGDGLDVAHTTACPCANVGSAGNGCANSVNANGANLAASGSIPADSVVLSGSGMPATVSCIYLQGDGLDDAVFGDGVRCAGGALVRLRTRLNAGGASSFPDSTDTVTLSQRGGVTVGSGATRSYQTYYRNSAALFCPPETFNVTNGWQISW